MRLLSAPLLALIFSVSSNAEARSLNLSLADAVRLAGDRNVSVLISNERVSRALERVKEMRSALGPGVTAAASQSRQTRNLQAQGLSIPLEPPRLGPFNTFDARLSLVQPLFDAASYERFRQARAGEALSRVAYAKARQDAMALVASLYLQARRSQEAVALAQALLERDFARQLVAEASLRLGAGTEVAAQQALSDVETNRSRLAAARSEADGKRRDLAAALGFDEDRPIDFSYSSRTWTTSPASWEALLEEHPDIQAARRQVSQDEVARAVERAEFLPQASVSADYGESGIDPAKSFPTYTLGVRLSLPLFDSGRRSSRVHEALTQFKESQIQLKDTRRHLKAEAESAQQDAEQAAEALDSAEKALAVAERQLALARERLDLGSGSDLDVKDASALTAMAKDAREAAGSALDMARVRLAKALGKMDLIAGGS